MASREGSRKRVKISRTESVPAPSHTTPKASKSTASVIMATKNTAAPDHHQAALQTLQTDIDAMRALVTCKICDRLLYEPYALACGHTYCYSCLSQWLVDNKKKTCPDCRAVTTQQPTPSYIVRELVLIFLGRNELLPEGETSEEHHKLAKEEAKIVADDKASTDPRHGGLFKGCFSANKIQRLQPMFDPGDAVHRCPYCNWELEDEVCEHCGADMQSLDESFSDSEIDAHGAFGDDIDAVFGADGQDDYFGGDDFEDDGWESDDESVDLAEVAAHHAIHPPNEEREPRHRGIYGIPWSDIDSEDEDDGSDVNEEGDLQGFVVNDNDSEDDSDSDDTDVPQVTGTRSLNRRRPGATVVISDSDDDVRPSAVRSEDHPESGSDDDRPRVLSRRFQSARRLVDSDGESATPSEEHRNYYDANQTHIPFSPSGRSECSSYDSAEISQENGYDDEAESESSDTDDDGWGSTSREHDILGISLIACADTEDEDARILAEAALRPQDPSHHLRRRPRGTIVPPSDISRSTAVPTFHGMRRSAPEQQRLAGARTAPVHPFQLENTLANVNYNQRHQQLRNTAPQTGSSARPSRNASGPVGQSSRSSGNYVTEGPGPLRTRRKRALSIDSNESD